MLDIKKVLQPIEKELELLEAKIQKVKNRICITENKDIKSKNQLKLIELQKEQVRLLKLIRLIKEV